MSATSDLQRRLADAAAAVQNGAAKLADLESKVRFMEGIVVPLRAEFDERKTEYIEKVEAQEALEYQLKHITRQVEIGRLHIQKYVGECESMMVEFKLQMKILKGHRKENKNAAEDLKKAQMLHASLSETLSKQEARQRRRESLGLAGLSTPHDMLCPITFDVMVDPVIASDGHTYEREAIVAVMASATEEQPALSPLTREPLRPDVLLANFAVRNRISGYETEQDRTMDAVEAKLAATQRVAARSTATSPRAAVPAPAATHPAVPAASRSFAVPPAHASKSSRSLLDLSDDEDNDNHDRQGAKRSRHDDGAPSIRPVPVPVPVPCIGASKLLSELSEQSDSF